MSAWFLDKELFKFATGVSWHLRGALSSHHIKSHKNTINIVNPASVWTYKPQEIKYFTLYADIQS